MTRVSPVQIRAIEHGRQIEIDVSEVEGAGNVAQVS